MNRRIKWLAALTLVAFGWFVPTIAYADEGEDGQDVARELYERGNIKSLEDVLSQLKRDTPGDIVGIALLPIGDRWIYRFQVIGPDGHRSIVDVDAGTVQASAPGGDD